MLKNETATEQNDSASNEAVTKVITESSASNLNELIETKKNSLIDYLEKAGVVEKASKQAEASKRIDKRKGGIFKVGKNDDCLSFIAEELWSAYAIQNSEKISEKVKEHNTLVTIQGRAPSVLSYILELSNDIA